MQIAQGNGGGPGLVDTRCISSLPMNNKRDSKETIAPAQEYEGGKKDMLSDF
jgi:hypothetical protein